MPAKKKRMQAPQRKLARAKQQLPPKLGKTEEDLIWHMAHAYQLEISSLGDTPILRRLKDNAEVRATANRSTIHVLQIARADSSGESWWNAESYGVAFSYKPEVK